MPDQNARHARSKWEWGVSQGRKELTTKAIQDDPAQVPPTPAKKKKGECKQNHWGSHEYEIVLDTRHFSPIRSNGIMRCQWKAAWGWRDTRYKPTWDCWHAEVCKHCGKRITESYEMPPEKCPDYVAEVPVGVLADVQRKQDSHDNLPPRRWHHKSAPTGPQGYRKPKSV